MSSSGFERGRTGMQGESGQLTRRRDNQQPQETSQQRIVRMRREGQRFHTPPPAPESNSEHQQEQESLAITPEVRFGIAASLAAASIVTSPALRSQMEPFDVFSTIIAAGGLAAVAPEFLSSDINSVQPMRTYREENILPGEQSWSYKGRGNTDERSLKYERDERMNSIALELLERRELRLRIPDQDSPEWRHFTTTAYNKIAEKQINFNQTKSDMIHDILQGGTNPNPPFPGKDRWSTRYKKLMTTAFMEYQKHPSNPDIYA